MSGPTDRGAYDQAVRARCVALTLAAGLLGGSAAPTAAAAGQGPAGAAVGDAGAAVAMMRLVAGSVPKASIMPGLGELVSPTSSFEAGFGLSNVQVNTAAELPFERSIAQATPYGAALTDRAPSSSGGLIQTAAPHNPKPSAGPLKPPRTPVDDLVHAGKLSGRVHARWSAERGPCVGTVASASTSTKAFWLGGAVVTLPDIGLRELKLPGGAKLPASFKPRGTLGSLGGLLAGTKPSAKGEGALLRLPSGLSTQSSVEVVGKAVRSTSRVRASRIDLLPGSPLGMTATVRRAPTLTVTSTGAPKTSSVVNQAPVIVVRRGGSPLFTLDRKHPRKDIPIGVPKAAFNRHLGSSRVKPLPVVGGVAESTRGRVVRLSERARREVVDLFVLRLSVGGLNSKSTALQEPFAGHQLGASARLLDVQLLPTEALADALEAKRYDVPSTLAQYAVGEQVVRAAAPSNGARCGTPGASEPTAGVPAAINPSGPAGTAQPLLWAGAGMLLGGALVLVFLRPRRAAAPRPSPQPRE
jgi:hypothetical protein